MKNNRICVVCRSEYHYCPTCSKDNDKPSWMTMFDTESCKDIYSTCVSYRDGNIDISEAKKKMDKLDVSKLEDFEDGIGSMVKDIVGVNKVVDETKEKEVKVANVKNEEQVLKRDTKVSNGSNSTSFIKNKPSNK